MVTIQTALICQLAVYTLFVNRIEALVTICAGCPVFALAAVGVDEVATGFADRVFLKEV
jgi:hypothetical protein